jgi:hypothetical protein
MVKPLLPSLAFGWLLQRVEYLDIFGVNVVETPEES